MRMRLITDDAVEVHFGLRLLDGAADPAHCHNYPGVNQAWELQHLQCWSGNYSNTLKRCIHEVDEAMPRGPSLSMGPVAALPALGGSQSGLKIPWD